MSKFSQNFWGTDFCSTAGYDTLVKRLKEGKQMVIDYEEYLERRAKIEKQYADEMIKLARISSGKDEIGTLRRSWDQLKTETENIGRLHMQLSMKIQEEMLKSVKDFRIQQKEIRRKNEDAVKRAQNHKKACYDKNNRLRSNYENKCREADRSQDQLHKLETNPLTKPNQLTQAHKKMEVARSTANNTDVQYQEGVKTLEEARVLWEREMDFLCTKFQECEEQRIAFLRHQMWTLCNNCSQTCVENDESYENVRKCLEGCDIEEDIDLFVRDRATGSGRPAPIPYENFYNPRNKGTIPGVPVAQKELPPLPMEPDPEPFVDSTYSVPELPNNDVIESNYSVPRGSDKVIALYDYESQGDQELELEEGDIIVVVGREDSVWWCGELKGKIGMFPSSYVEEYNGP